MALCNTCYSVTQYSVDGASGAVVVASCGCTARRALRAGEVIESYVQRAWERAPAAEPAAFPSKAPRRAPPPAAS